MKKASKRASSPPALPPAHDWRTTDIDEWNRRRQRAEAGQFTVTNLDRATPVFSRFEVGSGSGRTYSVEIRQIQERQFACDCIDFQTNGLGTCKHVEATLLHLEGRWKKLYQAAVARGPERVDLVPDHGHDRLRLMGPRRHAPRWVGAWVDEQGLQSQGEPEALVERARQSNGSKLRISQEVAPWLERRRRIEERKALRREYEQKVQSGAWPPQETTVPLFPYQREGMLHLAFAERALLADEMGLGKTIQAIAACALLHRLGQAQRVLIVAPASLKSEWEEQIQRFTPLSYQLVYGGRPHRLPHYTLEAPFFTITNYEQMVKDALDVNERLRPDVVVLDEAQRIKNWGTKTSQAIKRLQSRYAFVLTGTPIENRIDELHSLMDFLAPSVFGPLFRFNRDFYELDDRGKPIGYRNLDRLHERIRPYLLRRRKSDVETELPSRTDRNHFVPLSPVQRDTYHEHEEQVSRLASIARRRPLSIQEQEKLMRELAMMRMICDTNYILDPTERTCPKLEELEKILEECRDNPEVKVIVFSEWERMLELVRGLCQRLGLGFAWHTGSVPQQRRRGEINLFKNDPACRIFLSTDAGATGLNLQAASVVINCDLPWNPAKLEQRIARAWRKHQTRPVTVINLISEDSLEHRMLATLADKMALAGGVLDREGDLKEIKLRGGRQAMLERLQQILTATPEKPAPATARPLPTDRARGFAEESARLLNGALVRCEERYPREGTHTVLCVTVERDAGAWKERLTTLHAEYFTGADPLAPVQLEVIDRATAEAIERLMAAGLLAPTMRSSRPLFPATKPASEPPLSPADQARLAAYEEKASRQRKIAGLLGEGGMGDEARPPLLEAIRFQGKALAIRSRLPEPDDAAEALLPPLAQFFGDALAPLRAFAGETGGDWRPAAAALANLGS